MSIQIVSDLHLEFVDNRDYLKLHPLKPVGKILILGGDIMPLHLIDMPKYKDFLDFCSDHFERTYWIPGNHEYYNGDIAGHTGHFVETVKPNVQLVNNHSVCHYGTEIIMSTLWTKISERRSDVIRRGLNDYRLIRKEGKAFTTDDSKLLFEENLQFIQSQVAKKKKATRLVVTHHVPTFKNYPPEYVGDSLNEAFAVDLDSFIENSDIDYWSFGHHHRNVPEFLIGNTRMISNQLGYTWRGEQYGYKPGLMIGS